MTQAPPPQSGYQQPPVGGQNPFTNVQLNYWLSVFFVWIPALIFFLVDRGKDQRADEYHAANLNFSIIRTIVVFGGSVIGFIPYIGWLVSLLSLIAGIVLFVFHIMAAAKLREAYESGQKPPFIFNVDMVK